jgi:glycerate kinase
MLLDAASRGVREIIVGLGGSATNDGGLGMARALGFRFWDPRKQLISKVADLRDLERIEEPPGLTGFPVSAQITAAVDVRNPLLGARGATRVFGPQKGATPEHIAILEAALTRLAQVHGDPASELASAGAAGGLAFAMVAFCSAKIRSGFEVVAERISLRDAIRGHDVVVTGEGRLDAQTLEGKAPAGVAKLARGEGRRVFAIVGATENNAASHELFEEVLVLDGKEDAARRLRACAHELGELLR